MKVTFVLFFLLFACWATAQEPLIPKLPDQDSAALKTERDILYRQFLEGVSPLGDIMQPVQLPELNFDDALAQYQSYGLADYSFGNWLSRGYYSGHFGISPAPFLRNGTIFSQGSYKLNDKFKIGGYSFGANSIFSAPFPNQGINNFDVRGSTLFMEYKISNKFKIETRVSVSQGR